MIKRGSAKFFIILIVIFSSLALFSFSSNVEKGQEKQINVDISDMEWDYSGAYLFDGTAHTVSLINIPEGILVSYTDNCKTEVGSYLAKFTLSYDTERIKLVGIMPRELEWSIVKREALPEASTEIPNIKIDTIPQNGVLSPLENQSYDFALILSLSLVLISLFLSLLAIFIKWRISLSIRPADEIIPADIKLWLFRRKPHPPMKKLVLVRYKTTFTARLSMAEDKTRELYSILLGELLSYSHVKTAISKSHERVSYRGKTLARINVKRTRLYLYLSLNAENYSTEKYKYIKWLSDEGEQCPCLIRITGKRSLSRAVGLITELMRERGIPRGVAFEQPVPRRMSREELIERGFITAVYSSGEIGEGDAVIKDDIGRFFVKKAKKNTVKK